MSLVYLASPYSDPDPTVRQRRFEEVCKAANFLMKCAYTVFCPVAHSHPIELAGSKIEDHDFWMEQDIAILKHASRLVVLRLDGWKESLGVQREIAIAKTLLMPINYQTYSEVLRGELCLRGSAFGIPDYLDKHQAAEVAA